ncbi:MAG: hypothetical protein HY927_09020 [Elusimicrobia bacterium]|nr:hypothetical protein [Elusimicrobiota bacterium]
MSPARYPMNKLWSAFAVSILLAAAAPARAQQREIPKWEPVTESWGAWYELSFQDEAGGFHSVWCYYSSCGHQSKQKQANLYVFKQVSQKAFGNAWLTTFDTQLSPYVLTRTDKGPRVTKEGTALSAAPSWQSQLTAAGSKIIVLPPSGMAPDPAAEKERLAKEKAEKDRIAKDKAEKDRIAKDKADRDRAAKDKAERDRIAKDKAEKDRIAKDKAEKDRIAKEKAEKEKGVVPGNNQTAPAEAEFTAFEVMVLTAEMTPEQKKTFETTYATAKADKDSKRDEYNKIVSGLRGEVMTKVKAYVHHSWAPKNPDAPKVWDRFDRLEQAYIEQRLKDFPNAKENFDAQLKVAEAALAKGDAKKAASFIDFYRAIIKEDFNNYAGSDITKLTAQQQLEKMQGIMARLNGITDMDQAKKILDDAIQGKGTNKPLETGNNTVDGSGKGNEQVNQNIGTGNLANNPPKKEGLKITPPKGPEAAVAEEKADWTKWGKEVGTMVIPAVLFGFVAAAFGGPAFILGAVILGLAVGALYNKANE